ncbi:hypothetical protein Scep_026196 [Stephania cephalantha]|uniref:Uncharacterized protein n=1 Tax=Stephania cephalantha TaxID=152367 RepID=A0AAP0EPY2_9MAGN
MTDQQDIGDWGRAMSIGSGSINPVEFQDLLQRVAIHDRRLEEILTILRGPFPSLSTSTVAPIQDASAPMPHATRLPFTAKATPIITIVLVLPKVLAPVVVAPVERDASFDLTPKARLTRKYEIYSPKKFSGDFDVMEAKKFIKSHEKI